MSTTHQGIPLLDIIDRMDTGIKVPHNAEDLNPEQQVCCEELINCLLHFPSIRATAGALHQMFGPVLTGIFQSFPDVFLPASRKTIDLAEDSTIIQVTDILLQPLFHQMKA